MIRHALYLKLKKMIYSGELRPYKTLNLTELAKTFNTSLTPINSALCKLADEGLIIKPPNKTAIVAPMSMDEYKRDSLTGALLEGMGSYLATPLISSREIANLEKIVEKMQQGEVQAENSRLKALNREFHGTIIRECGNMALIKLVKEYSWKLYRYHVLIFSLPGAISTFQVEHRSILENIKKRDPAGARDATEKHITSAGEMAAKYFEMFA